MELSLKYKGVGYGVTITAVSNRTKVGRGLYATAMGGPVSYTHLTLPTNREV